MKHSESVAASPSRPATVDPRDTPGHLIRRCQQIAVAIFLDEFRDFRVTPVQMAALSTIAKKPGVNQSTLVDLIAVDRSTIGTILGGLEKRGLIRRVTPADNLRVKQLYIEPKGEDILLASPGPAARVAERTLAPLEPDERETFMRLLSRLVDVNNEFSRSPLRSARSDGPADYI